MLKSFNLEKTYHYLIVILALLFPLTVFGANLIIVLICSIWIISGDYHAKFKQIISNKLMLASILFFAMHLIGLLWTEDLSWGLHIVHKMWYFIGLFPILFNIVKQRNISTYITAFLIAILFTEICSYLVWFELVDPFKNATVRNPTPFMSHISYNPILAFAIYLILHKVFFNKNLSNIRFALYSFFAITMTINMFITGGRAGQATFFIILSVLCFQIFEKERYKSLLAILILIPLIFFTAYQSSDLFKQRIDTGIQNAVTFSNNSTNSIGLRLNFTINTFYLIRSNPIIGVGTGDFPNEYQIVNQKKSPKLPKITNPHNMYSLVTAQLGLLGLFSMLSLFYYQIKLSRNSRNKFLRDTGLILPIMFLFLMVSDSYLLGHYTTLMYVFFSSFLYKDFEKS